MAGVILAAEFPIISRAEAITAGRRTYFTGAPCVHGHIAPRSVGANNACTECKRLADASRCSKNKAEKAEYDRAYRAKNKAALTSRKAIYHAEHREKHRLYAIAYYASKHDEFKAYREDNKQRRNAQKREWAARNASHVADYKNTYEAIRKLNDPSYRLRVSLRVRLATAIRAGAKAGSAVRHLGCTIEELKDYLEHRFKPGMTWDNWSRAGWHVDHITPLASFDLTKKEQVLQACHYTNLQPLWCEDNLAKGALLQWGESDGKNSA